MERLLVYYFRSVHASSRHHPPVSCASASAHSSRAASNSSHAACPPPARNLTGATTHNRAGGKREEAEQADAAAAAACPAAAPISVDVVIARHAIARWRAFVVGRKGVLLLRLLGLPNLSDHEVLKQPDPTDRTMLSQVGRPWLAAVLASGLPRLPKGVKVRLRLRELCMFVEQLAWAKVNGCPWGSFGTRGTNACALAVEGICAI